MVLNQAKLCIILDENKLFLVSRFAVDVSPGSKVWRPLVCCSAQRTPVSPLSPIPGFFFKKNYNCNNESTFL